MGIVFSVHKAIFISLLRIKLKEFAFFNTKCCTFEAKYRPGKMCTRGTIISLLSPNLKLNDNLCKIAEYSLLPFLDAGWHSVATSTCSTSCRKMYVDTNNESVHAMYILINFQNSAKL